MEPLVVAVVIVLALCIVLLGWIQPELSKRTQPILKIAVMAGVVVLIFGQTVVTRREAAAQAAEDARRQAEAAALQAQVDAALREAREALGAVEFPVVFPSDDMFVHSNWSDSPGGPFGSRESLGGPFERPQWDIVPSNPDNVTRLVASARAGIQAMGLTMRARLHGPIEADGALRGLGLRAPTQGMPPVYVVLVEARNDHATAHFLMDSVLLTLEGAGIEDRKWNPLGDPMLPQEQREALERQVARFSQYRPNNDSMLIRISPGESGCTLLLFPRPAGERWAAGTKPLVSVVIQMSFPTKDDRGGLRMEYRKLGWVTLIPDAL
ncbi:MAG: hypothetical protein KF858_15540 [Candidatus Sumerlaeia bacterium]|nr:hypothetical protein [Candidatus Sumerlaeia bacterium]